jgi:uncharacterized membrane protein
MSFLDTMQTYFRGEKLEAIAFIVPIGILLVAFGVIALKVERGGFAWGVAVPCFLFGLIFFGTGAGITARTATQVAEIKKAYERAPAAMVQAELPRMQKVNANFRTTFMAFGALAALGLAMPFLFRADWSRGAGAVLVLTGAIGLLIDGFAEQRAVPYTAALEQVAAQHQLGREYAP